MKTNSLDIQVGRAFYGAFSRLTSVQSRAERPLLEGLDAVVISGTGSGKTEAVLAPLVQRHLLARRVRIQAAIVYVVPTKALGNDVLRRIEPPLETLGLSVGLRHGDAPSATQAHRAEVIVITPESLDVLVSGGADTLKEVRAIVIDEAHLLYNTQRGLQLGILIRRLEARTGSSIQVVCLSATVASPKFFWKFFRPSGGESTLAIIEGDVGRPIEAVVRIERDEGELVTLIDRIGKREHCKVLIFVNSRRVAEWLSDEMQRSLSFKDSVFIHHSSINSDHREHTEREVSSRVRAVCVATSTLELGIDIGDVDLVVLYGLVGSWESFLQRIGRGNRRGGCARVLCVSPHDTSYRWLTVLTFLGLLRTARSGAGEPARPMELHGAVVQQVLSILRERKGGYIRLADIMETVSSWPYLSRSTIDEIADALVEGNLCIRHGFQNRIGGSEGFHELERLRLLWGNFPVRSREVPLRVSGREIGLVPASNLTRLTKGVRVRFAGRVWTVTNVQANRIDVIPTQGQGSDVEIGYLGSGLGIHPAALDTARKMLIGRNWELNELAKSEAEELDIKWQDLSQMLAEAGLPFAHDNGGYRYLTFAGSLVNDVICRWEKLDAYRVDDLCIWSPRSIDFQCIPNDPEILGDDAAESLAKAGELTIFQSLLPDRLLQRDLIEHWCREPHYAWVLQRLVSSEPREIESNRFQTLLA